MPPVEPDGIIVDCMGDDGPDTGDFRGGETAPERVG